MTIVLTRTGREVDLARPSRHDIKLTDIALALSRIPRFNGHTSRTWSVADHSLLVADLMGEDCEPELALAALLHDAHEAYAGDMITPVQQALDAFPLEPQDAGAPTIRSTGAADFAIICQRLDVEIAGAFALNPELRLRREIKAADRLALAIEAKHLMPAQATRWPGLPSLPDPLPHLPARDQMGAQNAFIIRALQLIAARHGIAESLCFDEPPLPASPEPVTEGAA